MNERIESKNSSSTREMIFMQMILVRKYNNNIFNVVCCFETERVQKKRAEGEFITVPGCNFFLSTRKFQLWIWQRKEKSFTSPCLYFSFFLETTFYWEGFPSLWPSPLNHTIPFHNPQTFVGRALKLIFGSKKRPLKGIECLTAL